MIKIFFNELLDNYQKNLLTQLRGFGKEQEYLKYWVPGVNKFTSLTNLIDALHESKILDFELVLDKQDTDLCEKIFKKKNELGFIEKTTEENKLKLIFKLSIDNFKKHSIAKKKITTPLKKDVVSKINKVTRKVNKDLLNEEYLKKIQSLNYKNFKKTKIEEKNNCQLYTEILLDGKINLLINKETYIVEQAYHDFKELKEEYIVIDILLQQIENKKIQEVSEHSIIYLEHYLRPNDLKEKIKGIILPFHGGDLFEKLNSAVRNIYNNFRSNFKINETINKEYGDVSDSWKKMKTKDKEKLISDVLSSSVSTKLNVGKKEVIFKKLDMDFRVYIEMGEELQKRQKTENILFKIEQILAAEISPRIELFTTELIDKNKLRIKNSPQKIL